MPFGDEPLTAPRAPAADVGRAGGVGRAESTPSKKRLGLWLAAALWIVLVGMYFGLARFLDYVAVKEGRKAPTVIGN